MSNPKPAKHYAHYLGAPEFHRLNQACRPLVEAFGFGVYLVGSSLVRPDYRDVDIRAILPDDEFDRLFPVGGDNYTISSFWSLVCSSVSLQIAQATGLKIDFQVQRMSDANAKYDGQRNGIGWLEVTDANSGMRRTKETP